ncbi:MAG: sigma-70 family RNA polymerase sigma factor [Vicinamibacterales bacterium]
MPDDLDGDLLDRFVQGDQAAFEGLFRQFETEVFRWILRIVRDRSAAEDVLVEAFWRAYRGRARFDPSRSFGAWMRRIATNAAIDHVKATRSQAGWRTADDTLRAPAGPDRAVAEAISVVFHSLPVRLRVVATLALIEDQPLAEIAEAMHLPIGTVKSRVFRAVRILRKELARLGIHP